jgi:Ca-activated chloride channel family protein
MASSEGRHLARRPSPRRSLLPVAAVILALLVVATGVYLFVNRPGGSGACRSGSLPLRVAASPDQADLIARAAAGFARGRPTVDDRCVDVQVRPVGSVEAAGALAKGWDEATLGPRPDVWVPASSAWASELELQLQASGQADLVSLERPKVATSPLVLAMPKPMAQALGWPRRPLGWSDLTKLLASPAGWAALGHPQWGPFKLGRTDPTVSTPGLEALIATVYAATGQGSELTVEALAKRSEDLSRLILGVERSPGPEGDTPASLLGNLQRADQGGGALGFLSAVPVDEKSVLDYNQGNPSSVPGGADQQGRPKVPLVAVYPKEGTLEADHPWIVLRAGWVDDARRRAAASFLHYLQSAPVQASFQRAGFRSASGEPGSQVSEANGLLPDQPARILGLPDPKVIAAAVQSWKAARKRSNVLAVFDVSGSMKEPVPGTNQTKIDLARAAALTALPLFAPETNLGTWIFSTKLDGDRDYKETVPIGPVSATIAGGRTRREVITAADRSLQATSGDTGLYDTTLAAYQYVKDHYAPDRLNLVVLLTDGINDDPGSISLPALLAKLKAGQRDRPVQVITIAYGADADTAALAQIAKATGGLPFTSTDPRDIVRVFTTVITKIRVAGGAG